MSEEINIEERNKAQGTSDKKQPAPASQQPSSNDDDKATTDKPVTSNQQPAFAEVLADKPENQDMEVHKHPHHIAHKKKWGEYLLEFLMLFLAVFLGFLAENFREHRVEQERAKELAESLYKEVYSDSIIIKKSIDGMMNEKIKSLGHVIEYIRDSSLINPSAAFYNAVFNGFLKNSRFEPKDGILSQLRNSGSLRYFKNNNLQEDLGTLSVAITNVRQRNTTEQEFIVSSSRPFLLKHFDYTWSEAMLFEAGKKTSMPAILNAATFDKSEAINIAVAFSVMIRSTCEFQYKEYAEINHHLLEILRKEYQLE